LPQHAIEQSSGACTVGHNTEWKRLAKWSREAKRLAKTPAERAAVEADLAKRRAKLVNGMKSKAKRKRKTYPAWPKGMTFAEWYPRYLASPHWLALRKQVIERAMGFCEVCGGTECIQVHHLTYQRLRRERLEDLQALCRQCHKHAHGRDADDPISREFRAMFGPIG
jgi:hypothetical protein